MQRWLKIGLLLSVILVAPSNIAALSKVEEYQLKAVFLLRFSSFVVWPETAVNNNAQVNDFAICILGKDPFEEKLDIIIEHESYANLAIEVHRLTDYREAHRCRILFVDKSEQKNVRTILAFVQQYPILTVSEIEGFSKQGGIVEFFIIRSKVRFQISRSALASAGLKANANLLRVAKLID